MITHVKSSTNILAHNLAKFVLNSFNYTWIEKFHLAFHNQFQLILLMKCFTC